MLAMRPRDRGPDPVPVEARAYFSQAQIEKAEAFRTGNLWLYLGQTAIGIGVLVAFVRRPPERLAALRRPLLAGAAVAVAISVAAGLAALPLSAVARERAKDVGLVTQDWVGWAGDRAKSEAIARGLRGAGRRRARVRAAPLRRPLVDPRRGGRRGLRRDHDLPQPDRLRPALQRLRARPARPAAVRRPRARPQGRRRRRRGLRDGRVAPHDGRQRLRHRPRAHQARRALRHPGRRLHAGRDEPRRRPRARARAPPRRPQRAHLGRDRRALRHARRGAAHPAPRAGRRRVGPARGARGGARAGARRAGDHDGLEPALARRRAPCGRVLARADARPATRSSASSAGSRSRTSPTPIRRASRASCSAPTRRRWSGSGWPRRSAGEVHGAGGRPAAPALRGRCRALPEDALRPRARRRRRGARRGRRRAPDPRAQLPRAARQHAGARATPSRSRAGWRTGASAGSTSAS